MYTLADKAISEDEFGRAVTICTGRTLSRHLVHTVFQIFDNDGDGLLSYQEFVAMMKDRVNRGLKTFSRQVLYAQKVIKFTFYLWESFAGGLDRLQALRQAGGPRRGDLLIKRSNHSLRSLLHPIAAFKKNCMKKCPRKFQILAMHRLLSQ